MSHSVVRYQLVLTSAVVEDIRLLLHPICNLLLLVNKRHHNPGKRGNCLIMYIVYFGRTSFSILSCGFHHENQNSTDYLVIQLSVVRAMPGLWRHTSCLFVWGCSLSY